MDLIADCRESLSKYICEYPKNYLGDFPEGDYCIYCRSRDSECLEQSNYECILEVLKEVDDEVYGFRVNHFLVGWIEYVIVPFDSKEETLVKAVEILNALDQYCVYNEEHYAKLEQEKAQEIWENCYDVKERIAYIRENECQFDFTSFKELMENVRGKCFSAYANELIG